MAQARWAGADARALGVVSDQIEPLAQAVREGFAADVLVISGGVSEGAFDLVEEVLARFDVGLLFTKVAIKPGAPMVFGRRGDKLVFGLPGNPVSAQVTFDLFARAALLRMQGARVVSRPAVEVDLVEVARLAGILAAKRTAEAIPLCHPLPLSHVEVDLRERRDGFEIEARVRTDARTGAEMEALHAVAVAALTVYDMVKAADRGMTITDIRLLRKSGGRSGTYVRGRRP